ncbi:titin-like [Liolophura sinensis]|uniref:titin-like n=1 Tax=Liolophura sinensis TaxID=3198878 RepID=UPI003158F7B6
MQDNDLVKESKSATDYVLRGNEEALNSFASAEILPLCRERMENITLELLSTDECSGFYDCVVWSFGEIYQLVDSVDPQLLPRAQQDLPALEEQFYSLFENDTKSFTELVDITTEILNELRLLRADEIFCGTVPEITQDPRNVTVRLGESVTLTCLASSIPEPSYFWFMNEEMYGTGGSLTLTAVTSEDAGEYVCVAGNHVANVTSNPAIVSVISPPTILSQPPSQIEVVNGDEVVVTCNVSGLPQPNITWRKPSDNTFETTNKSLVLPSIQESDAGVYKCEAVNQYGTVSSREVTIEVLEARQLCPTMTLRFGFITVEPGNVSENDTLLKGDLSKAALETAFQDSLLLIANATEPLTADVRILKTSQNEAELSFIAGCDNRPEKCSLSACVRMHQAAQLYLQHSIARVQDAILSDQPLFIRDTKVYFFNPSVVDAPDVSARCPTGFKERKENVCVKVDDGPPTNLKISRRYQFGRIGLFIITWESAIPASSESKKQVYVVEVINRRYNPAYISKTLDERSGFMVWSNSGPTTVRVRRDGGGQNSPYAELVIPAF